MPTVTDSFNRADNATSLGIADTGETWSALAGTWGILVNQAYCSDSAAHAHAVVETGAADGTVKVTKSVISAAGECGLAFRFTDASNGFVWTNVALYKLEAGGFTELGSAGAADVAGDVIEAVLSGSSIAIKRNGTTVLSVTSTFNQTATKHGLRSSGSLLHRLDDFSFTPSTTAVGRSLDSRWHVVANVAKNLDARWSARTFVGASLDARWSVRTGAGASLDTRWSIVGTAAKTLDAQWDVRATVARTLDSRWSVSTSAGRDLGARWALSALVGLSLDARWGVRTMAAALRDLRWEVQALAGRSIDLRWDVSTLASIGQNLDIRWAVRAPAGHQFDLRWDQAATVGRAADLRWSVLIPAAKALDARWAVATSASNALDTRWAVQAATGSTLTLLWNVAAPPLPAIPWLRSDASASASGRHEASGSTWGQRVEVSAP